MKKMVDVLTLNYNDAETTIAFVESVKSYQSVSHIVIVDNDSTDDSYARLSKLSSDKIIVLKSDKNRGYGSGNNLGIRYIYEHWGTNHVLLSNPDVIIRENTISALHNYMNSQKQCAIAAPFMCNVSGVKQPNSAFRLPTLGQYVASLAILTSKFYTPMRYKNLTQTSEEVMNVGAVSGSCFMLDTEKFIEAGGFDERIFLYCEEVVLGLKIRNHNYSIALLPQKTFIHNHSVTISKSFQSKIQRQALLYNSKLYVIQHYFNPSKLMMFIARTLSKLSLFEMYCKEKFFSLIHG